jgi:hypothetical protein
MQTKEEETGTYQYQHKVIDNKNELQEISYKHSYFLKQFS